MGQMGSRYPESVHPPSHTFRQDVPYVYGDCLVQGVGGLGDTFAEGVGGVHPGCKEWKMQGGSTPGSTSCDSQDVGGVHFKLSKI